MNRTSKFLAAGLGTLVFAAGATFAAAHYGMGWRAHGMRQGGVLRIGIFCGDGQRVDRMLERLEERVKPTDGQKTSFEEFKAAAKTAANKVKTACPIESPRNVSERLGIAEKRLEAALDAVRTVRPAADKLYASLSDEQKAIVNGMREGRDRDRNDR
jgi:hypothetical protein